VAPSVGVLAIQGGFEAHGHALERLGVEPVEVRRADQLAELDALIIPGGESTTIEMGLAAGQFEQAIKDFAAEGKPVLGTCAGLIVLGEGRLELIDIEARRNAYGRQVRSFEAPVLVEGLGDQPLAAVFIRAPRIERWGDDVEVLAELDGTPVVAREHNVLVTSFHPELTDDSRLHAMFVEMIGVGVAP
jgi:5'-phosphate synthase pdxT subunit